MLMTALFLGIVVLAASGTFRWVRSHNPEAEKYLLFRCPHCGQKVRYLASKAGRPGMCPRCRQQWTLPTAPPPLASASRGRNGRPGESRPETGSEAIGSLTSCQPVSRGPAPPENRRQSGLPTTHDVRVVSTPVR
jgi:hypothetical protein